MHIPNEADLARELELADHALSSLVGEDVDAIFINSVETEEAPFLARIVSKLSPMVGNLMEQRIASTLSRHAGDGYEWVRQDPGFPDAVLRDSETHEIYAGYEIKAWYVMSTEITGRFRESLNLLQGKNVNVVIVAWCMSNLILGQPKVLGMLTVSGEELASSRDTHYHQPPRYLTIEPNDTTDRTRNLQQSNVNGYKLQEKESEEVNPSALADALTRTYTDQAPHTPQAQAEAAELMRDLSYRLDTNFAKIDRVDNDVVEDFKSRIMRSAYLGRTIKDWKDVFSDLTKADDGKRASAEETIKGLYDDMLVAEPKTAIQLESTDAH
ncbi:hypothetical protein [Actinomyces minihominis]|uniref:hypothetical protein n=1 Tax=Actinomyces minihominis TaxID=2002838 RepID=UPI00101AD092|nr:hypothetical protein [Actinomyces minihominis]